MESDRYGDIPEQKLLLLMKRTERISGKRYLRLVALDYLKGAILTIYDGNGEPDIKLHSWDKDTEALREMTVIKARLLYDNMQEYAAKALSPCEAVSKSGNLKQFLKKVYVRSLLSVIEGETNLPFPVSKPGVFENADNISIDQSFYNTKPPSLSEEEDMIFDMYWHYDEDEDSGIEQFSISEDDNLTFEWSFDNKKHISFREGEYQLIDLAGSKLKKKYLTLPDRQVLVADEKINNETNQGRYFNGFALIRRDGDSFIADRLVGKFERKGRPLYIDELTKEFRELEEKILIAATENNEEELDFIEFEIQYGENPVVFPEPAETGNETSKEMRKDGDKFEAILAEIAGEYPDYIVTDIYADDFATEYRLRGEAGKKRKSS